MVVYKKIARVFIGMSLSLSLLSACQQSEFSYTAEPAHFVFDAREHIHSPIFASIVGNTGLFGMVSLGVDKGKQVFLFANEQGNINAIPFNVADQKRKFKVGLNNGFIVGYGNLDSPAVLYIYDKECPHCFNSASFPLKSYPLTLLNTGFAVCKNCKREFNLNTGGILTKGEGHYKLTRYRGINTPKEVLLINN